MPSVFAGARAQPLEPTASGTWPARAVRGRRGFASSRCPPGPPRVQRCDRSSVPRSASPHPARVRAQRRTPSRPQGIDDDADTVHPLNRHAGSPWCDASYSAGYSAGRGHVCFANLLTRAQSEPRHRSDPRRLGHGIDYPDHSLTALSNREPFRGSHLGSSRAAFDERRPNECS